VITGEIIQVRTTPTPPGKQIQLRVDFSAFCPGAKFYGWNTKLSARLNGFSAGDKQYHIWEKGDRLDELLTLSGIMPPRPISGYVTLEGRTVWEDWQQLDSVFVAVELPATLPVVTPKPAPVTPSPAPVTPSPAPISPVKIKEPPVVPTPTWVWVAVGVAVVAMLAIVLQK